MDIVGYGPIDIVCGDEFLAGAAWAWDLVGVEE